MGCPNGCGKNEATVMGVCAVCEIIDGDINKKLVYYCKLCKKYICKGHLLSVDRGVAAIINLFT